VTAESSHTGTSHSTITAIVEHAVNNTGITAERLYIAGEFIFMEPYELLGLESATLELVTEVRTHPEVLEQCHEWLDMKFGEHIKRVVVNGTGQAAKDVSDLRNPTM
jgi:prephenate dehydratase